MIKILAGICLCYTVGFVFKDKRELAIKVILSSALLIVLYGFYQYFFGFSDTIKYINTNTLNIPPDELIEIKKNLNSKRIFSTFLYPNSYAGYLIVILPLIWGQILTFNYLNNGKISKKVKVVSLLLFNFGLIVSLILTKSFGGFLTTLFSFAIIFYILFTKKPKLFSKYRYRYFALSGILIICIVLFISLLLLRQDSIFNFNDPNNSIVSRLNYWKGTINIIKEYPLFGTGPGTFGSMYPKFKLPYAGNTEYSHNFYLQFASEAGLIGLISVLFLVFVIVKNLIKNCIYPGLIVAIIAFLIHSFMDFDFYMLELNIVFWFLLGLGMVNSRIDQKYIEEVSGDKLFKQLKTYFADNINKFVGIGIIINLFYTAFANTVKGVIQTNISFFITLISGLLLVVKIKKEGFNVYGLSINLPVIVFLVILTFSSILSLDKHSSTFEIFKILNFGMIIYIVFSCIKDMREIKKIIFSIITISFLLSLYALLKSIFMNNLTDRVYGNFPNSNLLAGFLACILILITNILIYERYTKKLWKFLLVISGITILISFILTGSRGGFLSLFTGLLVTIIIYTKNLTNKRVKVVSLLLFFIFILMFFVIKNPMKERIIRAGKVDRLAYKRIEIWKTSIKMIKENPIFGTGSGTYGDVYSKYAFPVEGSVARYGRYTEFAHNEYLHIAAEIGIFSLLTFLWFIFSMLKLKPVQNGESTGIYCAIITIFTHSIVDFNLHLNLTLLLLGVFIGMHLFLTKRKTLTVRGNRNMRLYFFAGLMVLLILLAATSIAYIYSEIGGKHKKNNEYIQAIKNYSIAIKLDSLSAKYYDSLGDVYETIYLDTANNKFLLLSEENFLSACKLNKSNGYYRRHLGFLYLTGFDIEKNVELLKKAVNIYNEAIVLNPYNPFFVLELGVVYIKLNDYERAKRCFEKAIELEPNYISAHHNLAVVAGELKDFNLSRYEHSIVDKLIKSNLKPASDYEKSLLEVGK